MQKGKTTEKAIKNASEYIKAKGAGMQKKQAMLYAGYTPSSARVPNILEKTIGYQIALQQITEQNAQTINNVNQQLAKRVIDGELSLTSLKDHADILTKLVKVHETLNPKVKLEQDDKGNVKATKWTTVQDNN